MNSPQKELRKLKMIEEEILEFTSKKLELNKVDNKKLAVLPFQNISPNNGSNYFSDGLTEEIIIRLSGIKELEIASRRTSMQYRDSELDIESLGRELNARYLLQGTVRKNNNDLRISTELIDVEKDSDTLGRDLQWKDGRCFCYSGKGI